MLFTSAPLQFAPDAWLFTGFALGRALLSEIDAVAAQVAFRQYAVPGGKTMSVAMTSCGRLGWVSSARGYAYLPRDPLTLQAWPDMPAAFRQLASDAANAAGWLDFEPDSCLVNRYAPGAGMSLHQDRNEQDLRAPIVSVSVGASCKFMFGGLRRSDPVQTINLHDGDVVVWGGRSRLAFHGVRPMPPSQAGLRYNLTFRQAGLKGDQAAS
jgi:DNA oxidative demethylase